MALRGKDRVIQARIQLLINHVFFGALAMKLMLQEDPSLKPPTMAVDGKSLFFHPDFPDSITRPELQAVLVHEVLHIVLLSHLRRGARDPKIWNEATDYAINLLIYDEGLQLPEWVLLSEKFRGMTAEQIYSYLVEHPEEQQPKGDGDQKWNVGAVKDAPASGQGENGEAAGKSMTKAEIEAAVQDVKGAVQSAAISAKKAGQLSAGLERLVNEICAPKAGWREILQRFVRSQASLDWDYTRSHTRMLHSYGTISPQIGGETLGNLAIIVDTSGSVDEKELAQFAGEINSILENFACHVTVIYCDTRINRVEEFTQDDLPLNLTAVGGGGTRGKPAYDFIVQELADVEAVIHYTDSYLFDWNEIARPEYPVLIACSASILHDTVPKWAEVIDIS